MDLSEDLSGSLSVAESDSNGRLEMQATLQKPASLTVRGVFKTMRQIAAEKGSGSATRKQRAVLSLLRGARCFSCTSSRLLTGCKELLPANHNVIDDTYGHRFGRGS